MTLADTRGGHDFLNAILFPDGDQNSFVILDGASISELLDHLHGKSAPKFECLYPGELEPDMAEVAPYLTVLTPDSEFSQWVLREGWGKHWGIFAVSLADLRTMRRHLCNLLSHYNSDGKPLLFRYYDPRVLRAYLPKCDAMELARVFGPVEYFVVESEDSKSAIRFQRSSGTLKQDRSSLG